MADEHDVRPDDIPMIVCAWWFGNRTRNHRDSNYELSQQGGVGGDGYGVCGPAFWLREEQGDASVSRENGEQPLTAGE